MALGEQRNARVNGGGGADFQDIWLDETLSFLFRFTDTRSISASKSKLSLKHTAGDLD